MKKLLSLLVLVTAFSSGCAIRTYQTADGTKISSYTLFQLSSAQTITVTTNGLKVSKFAGQVDKEALSSVVESVAAGVVKGMK